MELTFITLAMGLGALLGAAMLITVMSAYWRQQAFGLGGGVLSALGFLLVSLSVWKTAEVSVSADGGLSLKLAALEQQVAEVQEESQQLQTTVARQTEALTEARSTLTTLDQRTINLDERITTIGRNVELSPQIREQLRSSDLRFRNPGG